MGHERSSHDREPHSLAPDDVAGAGHERSDGRPRGVPQGAGSDLEGRPGIVRDAPVETTSPAEEAPTVAPEEKGAQPETEHAPGADL